MNRSESKYFNTAVRMDEAMMRLLEKKEFAYISIKEICALAGVNRSTFYLHYETTRDLLDETVRHLHERFLSCFDVQAEAFVTRIDQCPSEELLLMTPSYLVPYLQFVKDHRRLYAAALENPADFRTSDTYGSLFRNVFDPILSRFSVPPEEREYRMAFYLNGIAAIVSRWCDEGCTRSLEEVAEIMIKCIPHEGAQGDTAAR